MKTFLVYCLSSGEVFHFDTAREVGTFMWGRDSRQYQIFVHVSGLSNDISELVEQLTISIKTGV